MLTFKEYLEENLKDRFLYALGKFATHKAKPNLGKPGMQQQADKALKRGDYVKADYINAHLPKADRRGPQGNPWAGTRDPSPHTSSVPGVKQKVGRYAPTEVNAPSVIHLPGPKHPGPTKHQFHN